MGCQETQEEVERRELNEIVDYFTENPYAMQGNPFGEKSYRLFIKKDSSHKRNIWAFNRTAFFSLKDGFTIGLYALFGLIAAQQDEKEKLNLLKTCLDKGIGDLNELNNIPEAKNLTDTEKKLIINAYLFIKDALPKSDFESLFVPGGWCIAIGGLAGASVGAGVGIGIAGASIAVSAGAAAGAGVEMAAGSAIVGTGTAIAAWPIAIGAAIGLLIGLGVMFIAHNIQQSKKEKRLLNSKKNIKELFRQLSEFFDDDISEKALLKKLEILEKNNLFIIKVDFTSDQPVEFNFIPESRLEARFNYLPPKETNDEEEKLKREYYKLLFQLYGQFIGAMNDRRNMVDNMPSFDFKILREFAEEYKKIVDTWIRYCADANLERYSRINYDNYI